MGGPRAGSSMASQREVEDLRAQIAEMSAHLEGLEKERDFYFSKVSIFLSYSYIDFRVDSRLQNAIY